MLLAHYHFRCAYCGRPYAGMDHIVPIANGGGTTFTNVVPACLDCNDQKKEAVWVPPAAVTAVLTDGEHAHDERVIAFADLGWLNEVAQRETRGELWWEVRP
ncbi:MAG: HNH endonuclease [Chloroflexi bacterium]|nr:HNH endonuclease [Chloroflexota bacterium]